MDSLSIAASVNGLTCTCLTIVKILWDIVGKYKGVSQLVNCIHSEAKIIGFSLSQLQGLLLDNVDEAILNNEVREALDIVLTGCAVVFSCLKDEIAVLGERLESETREFGVGDKVSVVWREGKFKELLDRLRGQHGALGVLLQCLQMKSLFEIHRLLATNQAATQEMAAQTRSLRRLYPKVKVANSLLESPSEVDSAFYGDATVSIDSEKEFQFDDVVTNSQVYRRVLIQNLKQERKEVGRVEEDLIDLDLILVDLSEEVETEDEVKKGSFSNDLELLMVPTGKDDGEGENSGLDTPLVDDDGTITLPLLERNASLSETKMQHSEFMATNQTPTLPSTIEICDNPSERSDGSSSPTPDMKSATCTPEKPPVRVQGFTKSISARGEPKQDRRPGRPTIPPSKSFVTRKRIPKSKIPTRQGWPNDTASNIAHKPQLLETIQETGEKLAEPDKLPPFPYAFERWETLSAHWEGLMSFWIRRLEDNSSEISGYPLAEQLSRQVVDLSAAGANLFHAVVELQRLRASSERKFQRWFFKTRAEQEQAQERQCFTESELAEERSKVQKMEQITKELKLDLEVTKAEARRAWYELGSIENSRREGRIFG